MAGNQADFSQSALTRPLQPRIGLTLHSRPKKKSQLQTRLAIAAARAHRREERSLTTAQIRNADHGERRH